MGYFCFCLASLPDIRWVVAASGLIKRSLMCVCLVSSQRLAPVRALEHGLFTSLRLERKIAVCNLLLDISTQDTETVRTRGTLSSSVTNPSFV